jgi:hypothetical protein
VTQKPESDVSGSEGGETMMIKRVFVMNSRL